MNANSVFLEYWPVFFFYVLFRCFINRKYIYEPLDSSTKLNIDKEIRNAVKKFMPGLIINEVSVKSEEDIRKEEETQSEPNDPSLVDNSFGFVGDAEREYTLRVRIDYNNGDTLFSTKDFVIINL